MSRQLQIAKATYRGDPGILGSIVKFGSKLVKPIVRNLPGVSLVASAADLAYAAAKKAPPPRVPYNIPAPPGIAGPIYPQQPMTPMPMGMPPAQQQIATNLQNLQQAGIVGTGKAIVKAGGRALATPTGQRIAKTVGAAGTAFGLYEGAKAVGRMFGGGGGEMMPPGYHYNKALRRYEVADAQGRNVQDPRDRPRVVNEVVRNRSMNPLNPRALTRGFARIKGAQRWARKLVTFKKKVTIVRKKK